MKTAITALVGATALCALAGCVETTTGDTALRTAPSSDESACLSAVAAETGSSVRVLSSETSEANNVVRVGVGPDDAPWTCLISGGVVAEVFFAGNEGTL